MDINEARVEGVNQPNEHEGYRQTKYFTRGRRVDEEERGGLDGDDGRGRDGICVPNRKGNRRKL